MESTVDNYEERKNTIYIYMYAYKGDKNEHSTPAEFLIRKGNEINKK